MWIYTDEDLDARLSLAKPEGFLLDYWLFLHADETHSVWRARPFGLRFLATSVAVATGAQHRALVRVLAAELDRLRSVSHLLPTSVPGEQPLDPATGQIAASWRTWLAAALSDGYLRGFSSALLAAIEETVLSSDFFTMSFLLRRYASELADAEEAEHSIIGRAKQAILYTPPNVAGSDRIRVALEPSDDVEYRVEFGVSPVEVPAKIAQTAKRNSRSKFILQGDSGSTKVLTGIQVVVNANHIRQAVANALPSARSVLQRLRLGHYIRTTLHGPVKILPPEGSGDPRFLSLPGPFWQKGTIAREIPRLPGATSYVQTHLAALGGQRWAAAVWHVSSAIGLWPEDVHAASSEVWQGLESFSGSKQAVSSVLRRDYLRGLRDELLAILARRVTKQRNVLEKHNGVCDWRYWDAKNYSAVNWARWILSEHSVAYIGKWRQPPAPLVLFDERAGLLNDWAQTQSASVPPRWAQQRVSRDLDLLYGLRNAAVHGGTRIGNERAAAYLGRMGLEILFWGMQSVATNVMDSGQGANEGALKETETANNGGPDA